MTPEQRAKYRAADRARYANDPAYRALCNERSRIRSAKKYATDPEYREKTIARNKAYSLKRYYADPSWREAKLNQHRVRQSLTAREHVVERYLVDQINSRGGFCPKFIDAGRRGAPDRLVILPKHPVYFVELKRPKIGRLAPWQKRYHEQLRECGQHVWVLKSIEEVDGFLATL